MIPPVHAPRPRALAVATIVVLLAVVAAWLAAPTLVANRLRSLAAGRGLTATWRSLSLRLPFAITARGLAFTTASGDTTMRVETFELALDPWSVVTLAPRPSRIGLEGARLAPARREADDDPEPQVRLGGRMRADRLPRIRDAARRAARLMMLDPASLAVRLRDVTVMSSSSDDAPHVALHLDSLDLRPSSGNMRLTAHGVAALEDATPFSADLVYRRDGRLLGGARFRLGSRGDHEVLPIGFDARIAHGGWPSALRLEGGSTIAIGPIPLSVSGYLEPAAPRVQFALLARGLNPGVLARKLPAAVLGPLASVRVSGSFDYSLSFDLDLQHPDSVAFHADVTPHGLALDPRATRLDLTGLAAPFTAQIHLPHGRIVTRELSAANPHFREFADLDSTLAHAVVTNEDGGFFRHRGFNTDAVKDAITENLHAGAYRRGAGTITMQLARNLYLGHERTLSRKAQEVVLAWILEHLTGVPKRRLLEIYLNIIEWGPGVHGADEACQYYFGHGAGRVTTDEALFLATVVPSPTKWKYRFDKDGSLRSFERAQMHFIGRAMIAKGWLAPDALPPAESMHVELRGPAREVLFPPNAMSADSTNGTLRAMEVDDPASPH